MSFNKSSDDPMRSLAEVMEEFDAKYAAGGHNPDFPRIGPVEHNEVTAELFRKHGTGVVYNLEATEHDYVKIHDLARLINHDSYCDHALEIEKLLRKAKQLALKVKSCKIIKDHRSVDAGEVRDDQKSAEAGLDEITLRLKKLLIKTTEDELTKVRETSLSELTDEIKLKGDLVVRLRESVKDVITNCIGQGFYVAGISCHLPKKGLMDSRPIGGDPSDRLNHSQKDRMRWLGVPSVVLTLRHLDIIATKPKTYSYSNIRCADHPFQPSAGNSKVDLDMVCDNAGHMDMEQLDSFLQKSLIGIQSGARFYRQSNDLDLSF